MPISLKIFKFICCFWLHWVFVAGRGFSLVEANRSYSPVAACGLLVVALFLRSVGSRLQAQ